MPSPVESAAPPLEATGIEKCPTGIDGLDEILDGGVPRGRQALIVGAAGCGKTVLAMEFLARGATRFDEPGVFLTFEERRADLVANFASIGFDLPALESAGKLRIDHVELDPSQIEETGEYSLEALFIRLRMAIDAVGAKRVVLDTLEALLEGLGNQALVRSELRRLFGWLKEIGVTALITAERGVSTLSRHGLEEYVADCVILLEQSVEGATATRRLRVVKYRGSRHGTNLYPFLVDDDGISVLPITSLVLDHDVSSERTGSGVERLDALLGGGVFRGSSVLLSGTAGTGKTSLAATFADAACRRGERTLYLAFEESPAQLVRNMRSIGLDLQAARDAGLLKIVASRPTTYGLEFHLATIHREIAAFDPQLVVVDPISNFSEAGPGRDVSLMLARLTDLLKSRWITAIFTSLTIGGTAIEATSAGVSSLMDTWILLRDVDSNGERNRLLHVLKSRGSAHSNQVREFVLTPRGIELLDIYTGRGDMVVGSARLVREAEERAGRADRSREIERLGRARERQLVALEARVAAMRAEFAATDEETAVALSDAEGRDGALDATELALGIARRSDDQDGPA